ncbi:DUF1871 domain-containing protein [Bacillus canaveralius]|uniref:DUF1871 domain-containing protein n=1 Tax=Bacillus canaveralius TaxID=1403243 RepID=A0A2N5GLT5_9BACI|nr:MULTISPECIES: DUF1871 family protein [Bacillus]PLR82819.1 DUF1871 domain-containing protein [Bacillus canaveralius]PLR85188.1 DUF1871 domain-containing protein [Bacillus sp. V33-4]PLR97176.1 DUF1871 domain-containing protein [Bacillus canaveralius]
MQTQQINLRLVDVLNSWDPFHCGEGGYDTEIADVVQAVHDEDDANKLARKIQSIYEFSFEQIIQLDDCRKIAVALLEIKGQGSCSV